MWLGGESGDVCYNNSGSGKNENAGHTWPWANTFPATSFLYPVPDTAHTPHSVGSAAFNIDIGQRAKAGTSLDVQSGWDVARIYAVIELHDANASGAPSDCRILNANRDEGAADSAPAAGDIRIRIATDPISSHTTWKFVIEEHTGVVWGFTTFQSTFAQSVGDNQYYIVIEINKTSKVVEILEYSGGSWNSLVSRTCTATPIVAFPPSIYTKTVAGKNTGPFNVVWHETMLQDDTGSGVQADRITSYTSATTDPHVLVAYSLTDELVEDWAATNSCDDTIWRTLRTPEYDASNVDDYATLATGAAAIKRYRGTVDDIFVPATTPAIYHVGMAAGAQRTGVVVTPSELYIREMTPGVEDVQAGVASIANIRSAQFNTPPNSASWTKAVFEDCEFGFRRTAADNGVQQRCGVLLVQVIGTNLQRPSSPADCSVAFTPTVTIY